MHIALLALVSAAIASPCRDVGVAVVVDTARNSLSACHQGRQVEEFRIALGSGCTGKKRQGDAKVPLGEYPLGPPRGSSRFHTFIPIGYPTPAQRRNGYTGSAVGVHGPARGWTALPSRVNTATDWTLGCIAVGSDEEIARLARWVRRHRVARIVIR
jgi:L,D-peptidoglycan transpeptidase YkuD (ErfK/YbiS/YcfS/YnhG family)